MKHNWSIFTKVGRTSMRCCVRCGVVKNALIKDSDCKGNRTLALRREEQLERALSELLTLVSPIPEKEIPDSCGRCGTPNATCDMNCSDSYYMHRHNAVIAKAKKLLEK